MTRDSGKLFSYNNNTLAMSHRLSHHNVKVLKSSSLVAAALIITALPATAHAFLDSQAKSKGFNISAVQNQFQGIRTSGNLIDTIINIINALLLLAAIAAVVYLILGGVRYFSSQGDEDAVEQAKNSIIYAIVGIIVIILALVILNFFVANVV